MKTNKAIMQLNVIIDETARVEMGPSTIESIPVKTQIAILKLLDRVGDNINRILEKDALPVSSEQEDSEKTETKTESEEKELQELPDENPS